MWIKESTALIERDKFCDSLLAAETLRFTANEGATSGELLAVKQLAHGDRCAAIVVWRGVGVTLASTEEVTPEPTDATIRNVDEKFALAEEETIELTFSLSQSKHESFENKNEK